MKSDTTHTIATHSDTLKGLNRFIGWWGEDSIYYHCDNIYIIDLESIFAISCDLPGIICRNKYHDDTLYVYAIGIEKMLYFGVTKTQHYSPKLNSLFAKCYIVNNEMRVIYTQAMHSKNIEGLELNTVFHKVIPDPVAMHRIFEYADTLNVADADTLKGADRFIGLWGEYIPSNASGYVAIDKDTSIFVVSHNQLGILCSNQYHGDTLYLYVISTDQGRTFMGPKYYPPKPKSLFAKCYEVRHMLKIIYTQPMYCENIEDLELDTVLYKYE